MCYIAWHASFSIYTQSRMVIRNNARNDLLQPSCSALEFVLREYAKQKLKIAKKKKM